MTSLPGVARFRQSLAHRLGWTFAENDSARLDEVLRDRAAAHGLNRPDYLARLATSGWNSEIAALAERLSITETYFFRHAEQFQALRDEVLPERIAARATERTLRMISVGCASGEEAYSLAIAARQVCPTPDWYVSVIGVDANVAMLERAARARYSAWSLRETPASVRQRWFHRTGDDYQVVDEVRAVVRFRHYNVVDDDASLWLPGQYDVILCRNLLMYLTEPATTALIKRMTGALTPGGCLFLGHTDSLGSQPEGLELRQNREAFYYRQSGLQPPAPRAAPPTGTAGNEPRIGPDAYQAAMGLLRADRFAEALDLVTAQLSGHTQPRHRLLHGVLLTQTGQADEATVVACRLAESNALYPDAHQLLGLCREAEHAVDEAIAEYRLAAYLDPEFALPRLRLGQLARRRGEHRAAAAELEQALALLAREDEDRITLFGGGFGRIMLVAVCRGELDACGARR